MHQPAVHDERHAHQQPATLTVRQAALAGRRPRGAARECQRRQRCNFLMQLCCAATAEQQRSAGMSSTGWSGRLAGLAPRVLARADGVLHRSVAYQARVHVAGDL